MTPDRFDHLVSLVAGHTPDGLTFSVYAAGEESDFVRFNHSKVRQSGSVRQAQATVRLFDGKRHVAADTTLSGVHDEDRSRVTATLATLARLLPDVPEDPHLLLPTEVANTSQVSHGALPTGQDIAAQVCAAAAGDDLVGIYAGGRQWRGFADHRGQRNWFEAPSTHLDFSLVHGADKAVKVSLGGSSWDPSALTAAIDHARTQLGALARPGRTLPPGDYRAYLSPAAVGEVFDLISWDGFSAQAQARKSSCLQRLVSGEASLSPQITLTEDVGGGLGPSFSDDGFVRPAQVTLIRQGHHVGALTCPRTGAELGTPHTGADAAESPSALHMTGGTLDEADALSALGTGIWVSNLWYLNHSDRNAARFTGMTRFATFWVEDGEIVAPLDVMRFDVSLYDLLGQHLEAVTRQTHLLPSASTYGQRSTDSTSVPGVLTRRLTFTL